MFLRLKLAFSLLCTYFLLEKFHKLILFYRGLKCSFLIADRYDITKFQHQLELMKRNDRKYSIIFST